MSNINTVTVSGNLCADPAIKMAGAEGDFAIVNLRLANNRSKFNKETEQYEDETSYFDVTVFGKFGELVDRKLRVGDALSVQGRLEQQQWETSEGDKRSKVVIIASDIDSASFYKKVEDVAAKKEGDTSPASTSAAAEPKKDDDIPF